MVAINNLVLGLLRQSGVVNVPDAHRYYEANLQDAVNLLLLSSPRLCNSPASTLFSY